MADASTHTHTHTCTCTTDVDHMYKRTSYMHALKADPLRSTYTYIYLSNVCN